MNVAFRRHPQHDAVAAAVRETYRRSQPEMGYRVERHPLGWFEHAPGRVAAGSVTVEDIDAEAIPELAAEIRRQFGESPLVTLLVDDRARDEQLTGALVAEEFEPIDGSICLAYVGERPPLPSLSGVTIEEVDAPGLERWTRVKLQGFADSEDEPDPERLAQELALRRAEQEGSARFLLASVRSEPAAVIGFYGEQDWLIFSLATRLPFRQQRLAQLLLSDVVNEADGAPGCRSVLIETNEDGWPALWCRRFGFTDEVYWRRRYRVPETGA